MDSNVQFRAINSSWLLPRRLIFPSIKERGGRAVHQGITGHAVPCLRSNPDPTWPGRQTEAAPASASCTAVLLKPSAASPESVFPPDAFRYSRPALGIIVAGPTIPAAGRAVASGVVEDEGSDLDSLTGTSIGGCRRVGE